MQEYTKGTNRTGTYHATDHQVLNGALASHNGLDEEAQACEHSLQQGAVEVLSERAEQINCVCRIVCIPGVNRGVDRGVQPP